MRRFEAFAGRLATPMALICAAAIWLVFPQAASAQIGILAQNSGEILTESRSWVLDAIIFAALVGVTLVAICKSSRRV